MKTYKVYYLNDPRTNQPCYVGLTMQSLAQRVYQHNNVSSGNKSKIANLSRHLKTNNLGKLSIHLIEDFDTEQEMLDAEIKYIAEYRVKYPKLKNLMDGGNINKLPQESIDKMNATKIANGVTYPKGEDHGQAVLTEQDVLNIYSLIKHGYTNEEILQQYKSIKISAIKAIRSGQTWKHLWNQHFAKGIPSLKCNKQSMLSYSSQDKLAIVKAFDQGKQLNEVSKLYTNVTKADLKRIQARQLWLPVWELYFLLAP